MLAERIAELNDAYYNRGESLVPDSEYDDLVEQLRAQDPHHPLLQQVAPRPQGDTVALSAPMLSLQKAYTVADVAAWVAGLPDARVHLAPKYDGLAAEITFGLDGSVARALTRGDGLRGQDVTTNAHLVAVFGVPGTTVRGEFVLPLQTFARFGGKHPRNIAAGLMLAKEHKGPYRPHHLVFMPHFHYEPFGDGPLSVEDHAKYMLDEAELFRAECPYPLDGVVYWHKDMERLGTTAHHPKGAIALKFPDPPGEAIVSHTAWQLSGYGVLTPVVVFQQPVLLSGADVSQATAFNLSSWRAMDIRSRAVVQVVRRGGVIPHIEKVLSRPDDCPAANPPDKCYVCLHKLREETRDTSTVLVCPNDACEGQVARRIERWCKAIGAEGFGPAVCLDLVARGVGNLPELYKTVLDPAYADTATHRNQTSNLRTCRTVTTDRVLFGLSLPGLGDNLARQVARAALLDDLFDMSPAELAAMVPGLGVPTATAVQLALNTKLPDLVKLIGGGYLDYVDVLRPAREGALSGQVVCFTGELSIERLEACGMAEAAGAAVSTSVTRKTTLLVAADNTPSTKYKKAEAQGIRIVNEAEFRQLVAHQ